MFSLRWLTGLNYSQPLSHSLGITTYERSIVVDEDRKKVDSMIGNLNEKAFSNTFPDSNEGFRKAMREFWILNYTIEHCRLK